MSWRDNLIEASFRGQKFFVKNHKMTIGRNATIYDVYIPETAAKSSNVTGFVKDNGPMPQKFTVEGYVIQNLDNDFDYFAQRDALISVLQGEGAGTLRHPYYGEINVQALQSDISENFDDGGICTFTMSFVQKGQKSFSIIDGDFNARVDAAALSAKLMCADNFVDNFKQATQFVDQTIAAAQSTISTVQNSVYGIVGAVQSTVNAASSLLSAASELISTAVGVPCDLYNTLIGGLDSFKLIVGMTGDVITNAVTGSCSGTTKNNPIAMDGDTIPQDIGSSVIDTLIILSEQSITTNTTATDETNNNHIIDNAMKSYYFILTSQIGIRIDYDSQESGLATLQTISDSMDTFIEDMGSQDPIINNYETFVAMQELRSEFVLAMNDKISSLNKEVVYSMPPYGMSSLELSYNLYKDITREQEIINKNKVSFRHPAFAYGNVRVLDA